MSDSEPLSPFRLVVMVWTYPGHRQAYLRTEPGMGGPLVSRAPTDDVTGLEMDAAIDKETGLYVSRCVRCGSKLWQRKGLWADSPVKGMSGAPLVVSQICPAKGSPLQHVAEADS